MSRSLRRPPPHRFGDRRRLLHTGGWNDDNPNTSMMLEVLWAKGEVMIAGRAGQQRLLGPPRCPPLEASTSAGSGPVGHSPAEAPIL
jgi:hypothetical protein